MKKKILTALVILLSLVFLVVSFFGRKGFLEIHRARRTVETLRQEIKKLEEEKARLEQEIKDLETNPEAVEGEAREKLWLMRPDEVVIVDPKK